MPVGGHDRRMCWSRAPEIAIWWCTAAFVRGGGPPRVCWPKRFERRSVRAVGRNDWGLGGVKPPDIGGSLPSDCETRS